MLVARDALNITRNLELGGGLGSHVGGNYVIGVEELEEHVKAQYDITHCGRPHEARSLLWKS